MASDNKTRMDAAVKKGRYARLFRFQWAMWLLGSLTLGALVGYTVYADYRHTEEVEREQLLALGRIVNLNLSKQLENTDAVLQMLREELAGLPAQQRFTAVHAQRVQQMRRGLAGVRTLLVLDQDGTARLSSRSELLGRNFSQRDYFQRARLEPQGADKLFVSPPFISVLNVWAISLTRAIHDGNGQFVGSVTATLDAEYFATMLRSVRLAGDFRVALIHGEGLVFQAAPADAAVVGTNVLRAGTVVERHLQSGQAESFFVGTTPVSAEQRLMMVNTIKPQAVPMDHPLLLNISRDQHSAMALWREGAMRHELLLGLAVLLSGLALASFQRRYRSQYAQLEQADALLMRQHKQLSEAQQLAHIGSWELDLASNRLHWSEQLFRLFEADPARFEASYEAFLAAVHPDDRQSVNQAYNESLASRQPYESMHRLLMADGRIKWVHERCRTEYDAQGNALRSIGTAQDITAIKTAQDALATSERKLRMLIDHAADAVLIASPQERWVYVNDQALELLGCTREEIVGSSIYDIVPPSFRDIYREHFARLKTGESMRRELRLIHKDGHRIPVEMSAVLLPDGNVYGSCRDFSERLLIEQKLRVAAAAFETDEGILITDPCGVILQANRAFTRISGYRTEEAMGQTPAMLRSGRQDSEFYRNMWGALIAQRYWKGEVWNKRKNGEIYPQRLTITGVTDAKDKVTNYVAVFSDITERKAAEEQIHRLAFFDALTGLPNRRLLHDRFEQALLSSARKADQGAVLFIDLDRFKQLNDTRGHEVGDLLLKQVAQRMQSCVRENDTVARMGGDEFVVLLQNLNPDPTLAREQALAVAEKIRAALAQPYLLQGHAHESSPSIGACLFGGKAISVSELLRRADHAMYEAKAAGRNTARLYEGPSTQASSL